jgi:DnaK suppressor protein
MRKAKTATATKVDTAQNESSANRSIELRRILEDRRREIVSAMQEKMKDLRSEGSTAVMAGVLDEGEASEVDIQEDIVFALLQMKAETLTRIDEALARLEEGVYGNCFECGEEIAPQRLRALPFAVRCRDCEEAREMAAQRERTLSQRRGGASLFMDVSS